MSTVVRLPVRIRVTLAFGAVMAVVLGATGLFLYLRLGAGLDAAIQQGLRSRAGDVTALIEQADTGLASSGGSTLTDRGENLAQILDSSGRIVDSTRAVRSAPLLTRAEVTRARRGTIMLDRRSVLGGDEPARLLATPVRAQDRDLVVIVGALLGDRRDALRNLGRLLLIGGPVALLLALLAGYGTAAAALRPVERMRARAAAIQTADPGARLPVPPSRDEIGRLGITLNEMLERLEAAFERERAFVSDASHELRTPLTILKGEIELAVRDVRTREEMLAALHAAGEETDRLVQLAEDLLVIARADRGPPAERQAEIPAAELLATIERRYRKHAADQGAALELSAGADCTLRGDVVGLEQALGNLVDNALGHGSSRIEVASERRDGMVELHVRDDGEGFPPAFLALAFERFSRADPSRGRGGTGLGLALVAAVARAHGGTAAAANRPAGGADVWLSLPAHSSGHQVAATSSRPCGS